MKNNQFRPGAKVLAALAIAVTVGIGVAGCGSEHPATPSGASTSGETSSSVAARAMVDVSAVWASHPLPDCPRVVIGNATASPGLVLPDDGSVAEELAGVKSPAPEGWVREKLGWVTMWLAKVRADAISDPGSAGTKAEMKTFNSYVEHVSDELREGENSTESTDSIYPEGCR